MTAPDVVDELRRRFPELTLTRQEAADGRPTVWVPAQSVTEVVGWLARDVPEPFTMLFDLFGLDERERVHREGQPESDFTLVYRLLSLERNEDVRLKVALRGESPVTSSLTGLLPAANWYEREAFDMLGVRFEGHPHLARLLLPRSWVGHPLRKEHPARATEMEAQQLTQQDLTAQLDALAFRPEDWGLAQGYDDTEFLFLNLGPQHPGTHGVLRLVLQLDGERVVNVVPDIGFHHRGAEKMAERQTWHGYIPYTNRVDYLAGVLNSMAYLQSVEALAGIRVPDRAKVIRVMLGELFRVISHLVWLGTFAQDIGQMSPVFYAFSDREQALDLVEAICGARMHPGWLRIGGVAQDLPRGWDEQMRAFLAIMPARLREYEVAIFGNQLVRARTLGVGTCSRAEAIAWGVTGPMLRATGLAFDFRKARPYSGYDWFEFDIPTAETGDCHARGLVRLEEMRQSLRIIQQCVDDMPAGLHKADHPLTSPPRKDPGTMQDIETLIQHFMAVSWGPLLPPGEAGVITEGAKGACSYYVVSDGQAESYRTRIRAPSFAHMQWVPVLARGLMVQDLITILGALDFVLADVDR